MLQGLSPEGVLSIQFRILAEFSSIHSLRTRFPKSACHPPAEGYDFSGSGALSMKETIPPEKRRTGEILFCGISHGDPHCREKILAFLGEYQPEIILLEVSPFALLFRLTLGRVYLALLRRRISRLGPSSPAGLENLIRYLSLPREYRAVQEHCRKTRCRYRLVDSSLFSLLHLRKAHKILSWENLRMHREFREDPFQQERTMARRILQDGDDLLRKIKLDAFRRDDLLQRRERILIRRVGNELRRNPGKRLCYIGGWEHLMEDAEGCTLYSHWSRSRRRLII